MRERRNKTFMQKTSYISGKLMRAVIEGDEINKNGSIFEKNNGDDEKKPQKHNWISVFLSLEMNFFSDIGNNPMRALGRKNTC